MRYRPHFLGCQYTGIYIYSTTEDKYVRATSEEIVKAFKAGKRRKRSQSLWTNGEAIYSYATCLVAKDEHGQYYYNATKYSVTTTRRQNDICWHFPNATVVTNIRMGSYAYDLIRAAEKMAADAAQEQADAEAIERAIEARKAIA